MAFWSTKEFELKQKSKFIVSFNETFFLPNVKSCTKPSVEIGTKEYKLLNHTFNYPGTAKWLPIRIVFVDFNGNGDQFDTASFLAQMLNNTGYDYPNSTSHTLGTAGSDKALPLSSPEKSSTIANAFGGGLGGAKDSEDASVRRQNVVIQMLTPDGKVNEKWTIANPLIKSIKFGDLAYESDEPVEYEIEIVYDFAIYG